MFSTFAWYQVTQGVTSQAVNKTITIASPTLVSDWYMTVDIGEVGSFGLSDKSGDVWGVSNGVLVALSNASHVGVTLTPKVYKTNTAGTLSNPASANDLKSISASDTTYKFKIIASDNARISWTDPGSSFTTAFGNNINNTLDTILVKITAASGALTISYDDGTHYDSTATVYLSVSGDGSTNGDYTAGTAIGEMPNEAYASHETKGALQTTSSSRA